jgi:hypothetical protein
LTEAGQPVPADVVDLLSKTNFTTALYVTFLVNEDVRELDIQNVGTEALVVHRERSTGDDLGFQCGHSVGWLTMMYWYRYFPMEPIGSRWIANSKHVYLGWRRMFGSSASGNIDPASPSASPDGRRSRRVVAVESLAGSNTGCCPLHRVTEPSPHPVAQRPTGAPRPHPAVGRRVVGPRWPASWVCPTRFALYRAPSHR